MSNENQCPCCKALWVKFYLVQRMTKTDETKEAKIFAKNSHRHYWQGEDPDPNDEGFDVYNLEEKNGVSGVYCFSGEVNDIGLACYDDDKDRYRIVYLCGEGVVSSSFFSESSFSSVVSRSSFSSESESSSGPGSESSISKSSFSSSSVPCISVLDGINLCDLPVRQNITHVLALDEDCCLVRVPVAECTAGS